MGIGLKTVSTFPQPIPHKTSSMAFFDSQMFCKTESTESERVVVSVSCRGVVATRFVGLEYSMRGHEGCDTIVSH